MNILEVVKFDGFNIEEVGKFMNVYLIDLDCPPIEAGYVPFVHVNTPIGKMRADIGDFIVKDIKGDFYAFKPETYNQLRKS